LLRTRAIGRSFHVSNTPQRGVFSDGSGSRRAGARSVGETLTTLNTGQLRSARRRMRLPHAYSWRSAAFQFFAGRVYTPGTALPEEMAALHKAMHIQRV
jgi:hypothetical protein